MTSADPTRVIAIARSWLGTPYHDQASLRGVGCDCLGLARGVWRMVVGPEPFPIPAYSRDWGETGPRALGQNLARTGLAPVAAVGRDWQRLRADDLAPDAPGKPEAVTADAPQARLVVIRRAEP